VTAPTATDQDTMRRIVFHQHAGWQITSPAASDSTDGRWHATNSKAHLSAATLDALLDELDWSAAT
jgi:hypothetical protein